MSAVLSAAQWRERACAHEQRADALTADHRARAAQGESHPVWDFLFTYYSYKPSQLRKWHPGAGVALQGAAERADWRWYSPGPGTDEVMPDAEAYAAEKPELAALVERMLRRTASRPAQFGCFGLHEWAMVYRADEHRHPVPLRLGQDGTDAVVEAHELRCTHFDAFRFFTPEAVPRNRDLLSRDGQSAMEQPGCLHAGMDLYKHAFRLSPMVNSDLVADCFELAREIRVLDMRASPYDLTDLGFEPVAIETASGKAAYVAQQREFAVRGNALRARLITECERLMAAAHISRAEAQNSYPKASMVSANTVATRSREAVE